MNVSLHKLFAIILVGLAVPFLARSQSTVPLATFQDVPVEYSFVSNPNDPSATQGPSHGTYDLVESPPLNYVLTYTPNPGYLGPDTIKLVIWNSPVSFSKVTLAIEVMPSMVEAVADYATTPLDVPISINVLENDISNTGIKFIKYVPLVNNGAASFVQGSDFIDFTPEPGFEGIAHLNYVVCDSIGTCDHGTVTVNVVGPSAAVSDTTRIFTKKNLSQVVLIPDMFVLIDGPFDGTYDNSGEFPQYQPDLDFTGLDYLTFENGNVQKVIEVEVMDVVDNTFAFDDYVHMTSYQGTAEFNVLANDGYGTDAGCFNSGQPQFGSLTHNTNGDVVYTPPAGFNGVDWFTYSSRPIMCAGPAEIATVYVFVSNFEPASSLYHLSTPKQTPLVLGYGAPISNFEFSLAAEPGLGQVNIYPGQVDTTILGQPVSGYNMIVYIPDANVDSGLDFFEVDYCVINTEGNCAYAKTVKVEVEILDIGAGDGPQCFDDCVWSGDTNLDGIVDMKDLLPLGLCMGEIGIPRDEVDLSNWYGQYGEDWNNPIGNTQVDLKHLDTDGDSIVTALDTFAISEFYGNHHSLIPVQVPFYENEIVLEGNIFAEPGDLIELDMIMGSSEDPAVNVYGFTFPFAYNPEVFVPGSVHVAYKHNSWLGYNSPILQMAKNNLAGQVESGFTRTSGIAASGHGRIGVVRFVVEDIIDGLRGDRNEILVRIGDGTATAMNGAGQLSAMNIQGVTIRISQKEDTSEEGIRPDLLKLYPNPARNMLNVHLNGGHDFDRVVVHNITGQQLFDTGKLPLQNRTQLNVSNLETGLYFLTVYTAEGLVNKKFEVVK